jgi:hypothetical protein
MKNMPPQNDQPCLAMSGSSRHKGFWRFAFERGALETLKSLVDAVAPPALTAANSRRFVA